MLIPWPFDLLKALEKLKRQLAEAEAELEARKKPSEDTGPKFIGEGLVIDEWVSHLNLEFLVARYPLYHYRLVFILFPRKLCAEGKKRKILGSSTSGRGRFHMSGVFSCWEPFLVPAESMVWWWVYVVTRRWIFILWKCEYEMMDIFLSIWVVSSFLWWLVVLIIGLSTIVICTCRYVIFLLQIREIITLTMLSSLSLHFLSKRMQLLFHSSISCRVWAGRIEVVFKGEEFVSDDYSHSDTSSSQMIILHPYLLGVGRGRDWNRVLPLNRLNRWGISTKLYNSSKQDYFKHPLLGKIVFRQVLANPARSHALAKWSRAGSIWTGP